jgi:hypothetical protein
MTDGQNSVGMGGGGEAPHRLVESILVTIFCCQPLGIVAIVFSALAMSANGKGDYADAWEKSKKAKMFIWIGFGVGLAVGLAYGALMLLGGGLAAASGAAGSP